MGLTPESVRILGKSPTGGDNVPLAVDDDGKFIPSPSSGRNNPFATLLNALPDTATQEIRGDDISAGDLYFGRAPDGTLTSAASWEVVRFYRTATGAITRIRYRSGVVWDNRTAGWT